MINVTHEDILTRPTNALTNAISFLVTPDHSGRHTLQRTRDAALLARIDYAASLIAEAIDAGNLRLSPGRFVTTGGFIPNRAIEQLLARSSRLSNFRSEVMAAGVYDLVTEGLIKKNVGIYTGRMDRLVSSLVAASDVSAFSALDTSDVLAWLKYHYDAALRTFANQTLWGPGANLSGKCIRTLAGVIGNKFENFQIQQMTFIRRTAQPGYKHGPMKENPPVEFVEWMDHWKAWRGTVPPTTDGGWLGCDFLIGYLTALNNEEVAVFDPYQFLLAPRPFSLRQHLVKCHAGGRSIRSIIQGAGILAKFSEFLVERLDLNAKSVSYTPLFTRSDERQIKGLQDDSTKLAPLGKVAANPMPPRLGNVYRQMLLEGPNGWPATHHLCQHPDGSYNPTMPTLFILADELASRVAQIVRLDSGEGDLEIFDAHKMEWVDNTGPCAGYWKRETPKEPNRGFARRSDDHQITGIFLNTNKSSPNHFVPWQNVFALTLLYDLFLYQREHNPISGPVTAAAYLAAAHKADDKKILTYPSIFPLFRMPPVKRQRVSSPVTVTMRNRFWRDSNEALQERWNATHDADEQINIVSYNEFGQVDKTIYTAHGLRSAGITRLEEGGADFSIISELAVGHASHWMTFKYVKRGSRSVSDRLDEARARGADPETQEALIDLKNGGADAGARLLVRSSQQTLFHALPENGGDFLQWAHRDHGICTTDGEGCSEGGPLLRSGKRKNDSDQSIYGYVRGGDGNCFLCRFHMTDPKWVDGVEAYGNLCLERIAQMARRINELQAKLDSAAAELRLLEPNSKGRLALRQEISRLEAAIINLVNQQEILSETVLVVRQKLQEIAEVQERQTQQGLDPTVALIASHNSNAVHWVKMSRFEYLASLATYGQIYVSLYDHQVDDAVKSIINEVAFRSGYEPISMRRCSPERRREMYDNALKLILSAAERFDMNRFDNETVSLDDLGISAADSVAVFGSKLDPIPLKLAGSQP